MDRRLYTPPTCTLLIEAPKNWLPNFSQKSEQPEIASLANLHFALSFDDPCQTADSITVKGDRPRLDQLYLVVNNYVQKLLGNSLEQVAPKARINSANSATSQLQQQNLFTHTLHLGDLLESEVRAIDLTTTQLFDLVTALDAYTKELHAPGIVKAWWKNTWFSSWGLSMGAISLFVGLTSVGFHLLQVHNAAESTPEVPNNPNNSNSSAFNLQVFPIPKVSIPSLPSIPPLAATQKIPLPAPVQAPASGIATSTPLIAPLERSGSSGVTLFPDSLKPQLNNNVPSEPSYITANPRPTTPQNSSSLPTPSQNSAIAPLAPSSSQPYLPNLPTLNPEAIIQIPPPEVPQIKVNEDLRTNRGEQTALERESLFDRLPQVPQVRKYFQARWRPPLGLTQVLEYSLALNRDGSIARIIPLGQVAAVYIDRLGVPALNAPIVAPLTNAGNPQIRLVFTPEGGVQTFLEAYD